MFRYGVTKKSSLPAPPSISIVEKEEDDNEFESTLNDDEGRTGSLVPDCDDDFIDLDLCFDQKGPGVSETLEEGKDYEEPVDDEERTFGSDRVSGEIDVTAERLP